MPVLDIAANQQYAQPVTAYYQGKAMRLAEQMNQRKMEMEQRSMEMAEEELSFRKSRVGVEDERYYKEQERLDSEAIAASEATTREIHDKAAEESANFQKTPEIRAGALTLLEGHLKNPTQESTQNYLDYVKQTSPNFYSLNKDKFDKNGDGILDVEVVKNVVGLIKAANTSASDKNTYGTGTTAGINPMTGKMDTFVQGKDGSTKWLGIAPAESNKDENPFGNSERGRALFIQLQRIPPGPARDAARDKWSALVAEMPQHRIDPVTGLPTTTQVDFPGIGSDAPPSAQSSSVEQPYPDVPEEDLAESADVIAGPIASVKRLLAKTPLIGIKAGDETEAAKFAEQVNRDLVDSFRRSPRFAEMDRKDLEKEFDFNPAGYDTQQSYLTRLAQVTKNVETKINQHSKTINENGISKEERQKRMNLLVELKEVRALMAPIRLDTDDQVEEFYETAEPGDKFFAKHPITDQWTVFTFNGQGGE